MELSTLVVGFPLTLPQRCLLYLLDRGDLREEDPAAQEATQDWIAEAIGARRAHISRAMGKMGAQGLLKTAKVHVAGEPRRRLAYFLSEAGLRRAQSIRAIAEEERLTVVDLEGNERERRLYEVPLLLPRRPKLSDLITMIAGDRLDLRAFVDRQSRLRRGKVYDVRDAAAPSHFRGRGAELDRLESFLADPRARGLVLVGLPGIGKTALAAQWVETLKGRFHVLWRRVHADTTATDLLRDLGTLLSGAGHPALSNYLERPAEGGNVVPLTLLRRDLARTPALLVVDDAHRATAEVRALLDEILHADVPSATPKVLLLSRERIPFIRADDFARSRVWEVELDDLARPDALAVLEALRAPAERREEILARCGGHPLSLELAGAGSLPFEGVRGTSAAWFAEEALSRVGEQERRALALACVFEGAAPLATLGPGARGLLRRCLLRQIDGNAAVVHDLVRDAVLETLSVKRLEALHLQVGTVLAGSRNPGDAVAAIRHFLRGRGFARAAALALERGNEIIEAGLAGAFVPLLDSGPWAAAERPLPPRVRLLRGQALYALGRRAESSRAFAECGGVRDPLTAAEARLGQGKTEFQRGSRLGLPLLLDARDRLEGLGALRLVAEAQYWIGGAHEAAGRYEEAQEAFERGRAVALDIGDRQWEGLCTYGLGRVRSLQRDFIGAVEMERQALDVLERGGYRLDVAKVCAGLGGNLLELKKFDEALECLNRATTEARTTGAMGVLASSLYNIGAIHHARKDVAGEIVIREEALATAEAVEEHESAARSAAWLAWCHWTEGRDEVARQYVRRAEDLIARLREPALRITALRQLGLACLRADRREEARGYLETSLTEARKAKLPQLEDLANDIIREIG